MIIITFSAMQGGVGKSTLAFNYGEWLASLGKKVLFLDLDHQCNLTQTFEIYDQENTVASVFTGKGEVEIHNVRKNVDIIPGYMRLDEIEENIANKANKEMLLFMWLDDNLDKYSLSKYDYIIIDTHPGFGTATKNAVAVSHTVISPLIPSKYSFESQFNLETRLESFKSEMINFTTKESYITAQLFFVANKVKHNTNSSRSFLNDVKDRVVEVFPDREIFNKTTLEETSLSQLKLQNLKRNELKTIDEIELKFKNLKGVTEKTLN